MKKLFYLFVFFSFSLSSCSNDEDISSNSESKLIRKIVSSANGSNTTFIYVYNGTKLNPLGEIK